MQEVYANAVLTIAADSAEESSCGLNMDKCRINPSYPIDVNGEVLFVTNIPQGLVSGTSLSIFNRQTLFKDDETGYLDRRGWTLQERILSLRILHYDAYELDWKCEQLS